MGADLMTSLGRTQSDVIFVLIARVQIMPTERLRLPACFTISKRLITITKSLKKHYTENHMLTFTVFFS